MAQAPEDRWFERWCRRGDPEALGALFDATAPRLLKLAIHLVGDAGEAEDLVQATFLAALEQRASVDPARPVMPWLSSVLAHKAQQHRRRAARAPDPSRLAERAVVDPSRPLERRELDGELARAIDALGEPYRAVLVLRLRHAMGIADIAHVLERDPGTVRVQLHRGLEKLRAVLPATLVSSLLAGWLAPRGLAAVREAVLERAAALAAGASTSVVIGGMIVSKKILVSAAAVLALLALVWLRRPSPGATPAREVAVEEEPAMAPFAPPPAQDQAIRSEGSVVAAGEREPLPSSAPALRGRVLDAETQGPIAGATLRLFEPREAAALDLLREQPELYELDNAGKLRARTRADWPLVVGSSAAARFGGTLLLVYGRPHASEEPAASTRSASDGSFSLPFGERGGVLEGACPGYATRWRAARSSDEPLVFELWREREVRGVVLGPDLEPVTESLELVLTGRRRPSPESESPAEASPHAARSLVPHVERVSESLGAWSARTDGAGRFRVRVGADSVVAHIVTPGWGEPPGRFQHGGDGENELRVYCERVPSFRFFDAKSGAPVERVRLLGRELANRYVHWSGEYYAPGGWLEMPGDWSAVLSLGKATFGFVAWSEGYAATHVPVPDVASATTIEVPLDAGAVAELEGIVLRDGTPIADAEVALLGRSPLQWGVAEDFLVDAVATGTDGRFRLAAASGSYLLRVREDDAPFLEDVHYADQPNTWLTRAIAGREPCFLSVDLPAGAGLMVDLGRTGRIEVEIVDSEGAPRMEHMVALRALDGRQSIAHTDGWGIACFRNLPAGRYQLHTPAVTPVNGFSFGGGEQREVELAAAGVERVRIELQAYTGPRQGRVLARGVSDYSAWRTRFEGAESWTELAADGTLPLDLATDHYGFEVQAPDGRSWHLDIPKDMPEGHVFELEAGSGIYRGRLEHADGSPRRGVAVHAVPWGTSGRVRVHAVTDAAGSFELPGLDGGEHRLMFNTRAERSPWDDWNNALAGVVFLPAAPPSESGTWLSIRAADPREVVHLCGTVERAGGQPLAGATLVFECDVPQADGVMRLGGGATYSRTDEHGVFDVRLPRAPRMGVKVYETWTKDGLVLTQELGPGAEDGMLRLVVR